MLKIIIRRVQTAIQRYRRTSNLIRNIGLSQLNNSGVKIDNIQIKYTTFLNINRNKKYYSCR